MGNVIKDHCLNFHVRVMNREMRASNPCALGIAGVLVDELSGEYKNLFSPEMTVRQKPLARRPLHECTPIRLKAMERHNLQSPVPWAPGFSIGINPDSLLIVWMKVPKLHQQHTALTTDYFFPYNLALLSLLLQ